MWVSFFCFFQLIQGRKFKAISGLTSSSSKSLLCLPSHLTIWDNKIKKKLKHIIISSASLPTFRHHCNSASDVDIWAWFSFNGFNNKMQSNVNKWFVLSVFYLFQHKSIWGRKYKKQGWLIVHVGVRNVWRCDILSDALQPSLGVNQSSGSLAVTNSFGPKVLGVTRCGGKVRKMLASFWFLLILQYLERMRKMIQSFSWLDLFSCSAILFKWLLTQTKRN